VVALAAAEDRQTRDDGVVWGRPAARRIGFRMGAGDIPNRIFRAPGNRRSVAAHSGHPGLREWTDDYSNLYRILR
jgi:hypothetical protein